MHNKDDESKLDLNIQQLFNKYQNWFSKPLKEVKFANFSSRLPLDCDSLNYLISLQNEQSPPHF
jgi:hypothetical protein